MSSSPRGWDFRRSLRFWISAWLPVAIGCTIIAIESTPYFGSDRTSGPLRTVFEALFGRVTDAHWIVIHHYIRKSGHFIGYGLLGVTWLRAWWMTLPRLSYFADAGLGLLGTFLVASCDEWHQSYLPNRTSSVWDVMIDCCGAITMMAAVYLYLRSFRPRRLIRAATSAIID
jgi:VanZ family protein